MCPEHKARKTYKIFVSKSLNPSQNFVSKPTLDTKPRESYFSDAVAHFIALILIVVGFIYFLYSSGVVTYVIGLIAAGAWILSIISHWQDYRTSIIVDEDGITEKYLTGGGGWSYEWGEISEWNALLVGDGDREIRFTTTGSEPKTHTLPIEKIGKGHYWQLKDIFLEHCGKPTKVDSLLLANAPDDE